MADRPCPERTPPGNTCNWGHGCHRPALFFDGSKHYCNGCVTQAVLMGHVAPPLSWGQSSAGWTKPEPDPRFAGRVKPAVVVSGVCGCGCGQPCKAVFAPGHDSKLKAARRAAGLDPYTGAKR